MIGLFALILLLLLAAWCDLWTRRIPNALTLAGLCVGLALGFWQEGWSGFGGALLGSAAGFAVFFVFYCLGGMGAGDVKLMAAAGAFLGVPLVFWAAVCSGLAGGVLALVVVARRRALARTVSNFAGLLMLPRPGLHASPRVTLRSPQALAVPYGVAIALGCAFGALFPELSVF